jgi:hypothetical protein
MDFIVSAAAKPIVDWGSLIQVVYTSLIFGVGVVVVMSASIVAYADASDHTGIRKVLGTIAAVVGLLAIVATVIFGIVIMTAK